MKQVAVLGANGQLGKTIKSLAKDLPENYTFFTKQDIDITDKVSVENIFRSLKYDFCVNCAAYTNVEAAEANIEDAFSINAEGVKNIANVCREYSVKLIHISTDYVFDGKKKTPYKVDDITNPINQYGKSKLQGELYLQEALGEYYIIRTSWLYSSYGKNFVKTIINKTQENKTLKITTEEKGTPTSCIDLSYFVFYIVSNEDIPYGIYNFSAKGSTTWYGFAKEIVKNFYPERITNISPTDNFKTLAERPKYSVLDISETERVYRRLNEWQKSVKTVVQNITARHV